MLGKGTSDERFYLPAKEVVERSFRSVLLSNNMFSYMPECSKETSDPYVRCYQQISCTLPFFVDSCSSEGQTSVVPLSDTCVGTFRIIIAYQESIITSVEHIYGKANFFKMLIDVDNDNLRTVLLQTPNTSHSYPF